MQTGRRTGPPSASSSSRTAEHRPGRIIAAVTTAMSFLLASVAVLLAGAPAAAAAPPRANATQQAVTLSCNADASALLAGTHQAQQRPTSFAVDAPATATQGQNYTVTVTPGSTTIPTTSGPATVNNVRDFAFRFAIPAGATYVSGVVNDDGVGSFGTGSVSQGSANGVSFIEYDITGPAAAGATVTFPSVTVTLQASGAVDATLPVQFTGSASNDGSDASTPPTITAPAGMALTANVTVAGVGTGDVPTQCAPFGTSPVLASTTIVAPKTATTTTASASPTTALTTDSVALSADVTTAGDGTPTGTVQFMDGDSAIGDPVTLDGSAHAELDHTFTTAGGHSVAAVYSGDDTFATSTSAPVTVTVSYPATDTTTDLTAVPATVPDTGSTTLTATVSSVSPPSPERQTPVGTVQFMDGDTALGAPVTVDGTGEASSPETLTGVADHSITAVFTPTDPAAFNASTSDAVTVSVTPANPTSVTLGLSSTAVTAGEPITASATVTSEAGTPSSGTVQFMDGTDALGDPVPVAADGTASATIHLYGAGDHDVTAVYSGGSGFGGSTSAAVTATVSVTDTATAAVAVPSTAAAGAPVAITATVTTADGGLVTGQVQVVDVTNAASPVTLGTATLVDGKATVTATFTTLGTHTLAIHYTDSDGAGFNPSDATASVTVLAAPVTVSVSASPTTVGLWDLSALTATVTGDGTHVPTGTVSFWDGTRFMGSVPVAADGTASWPVGWFETAGAHTVQAVYTPDTDSMYSGGSATTTVTVNPAPTGWPVTGTLALESQAPNVSPLPAGSRLIDNSYNPSTGELTGKFWSPGVEVRGSNETAAYDLDLRFSQHSDATGTVDSDGTVTLNSQLYVQLRVIHLDLGALGGEQSTAMPACTFGPIDVSLTGTATATGLHLADPDFTIPPLGDDADCGSVLVLGVVPLPLAGIIGGIFAPEGNTNSITLDVPGDFTPPTATSIGGIVVQGPNPIVAGDTVNVTATVTATDGPSAGQAPTGTVNFVDVTDPDNPVTLGSGTIAANGSVTTSFVMPTAGDRSVVAKYGGEGAFAPAASEPFIVHVAQDPTTLGLTADPSSVGVYDAFRLTATATAGPLPPSGTVTFSDVTDPDNPAVIGTASIAGDGTATYPVASLTSPGEHTIEASYPGDTNHTDATATTTVTVAPAPAGWAITGTTNIAGQDTPLPEGTRFTDNSYNPSTGVLQGRLWAPAGELNIDTVLGTVTVVLRLGQPDVATGMVDPDGTVSLDADLSLQLRSLSVPLLLPDGLPVDNCTFEPIPVHLTGTVTETGLHLEDDSFAIAPLDSSYCGGLGELISDGIPGIFSPGVAGSGDSISLDVDGDFTPPPASSVLVNELYHAVLNRAADPAGLAFWTAQLDAGTTPAQLVTALATSAEGSRIVVTDLYQTALGRSPDGGGLAFWSTWLQQNGRPDVLLAMLQASTEAYTNAGGNNIDWVRSLYQQLLQRDADPGGLNYWVARLATGTSRQDVALTLGATAEAVSHAVAVATTAVCGTAATGSTKSMLEDAYRASHHDPAVLAGLAELAPCPAPPAP